VGVTHTKTVKEHGRNRIAAMFQKVHHRGKRRKLRAFSLLVYRRKKRGGVLAPVSSGTKKREGRRKEEGFAVFIHFHDALRRETGRRLL